MQITRDEEKSIAETTAVFVVVSEKERYPTGSTLHTIPKIDKTTNVWNINYTNYNQHSAGQNFATFHGTHSLQRSQDPATVPYPGPCGKKVMRPECNKNKYAR